LINYAKGFTLDIEIIEDVIHDCFVYIWNNKSNLTELDNIRPYLMVSLRHRLLKYLKKKSKVELKEENDSFLEYDESIETIMIKHEFKLELKGQLNDSYQILSSRQKEAIFLRYMDSMEYEEICKIMDINYQSVRNLISQGIKKLEEHLKKKIKNI